MQHYKHAIRHTARMDPGVWAQVDVSAWEVFAIEQSGTSVAEWLVEPSTDERWLHKPTDVPANGVEQGEDWSEVVSTQVAVLLGVPCAPTRLCVRNGRRGSISRSIRPETHGLHHGAVVLEDVPGFVPQVEGEPRAEDPSRPGVRRPGHTLGNIRVALDGVVPPTGFALPTGLTAFDVFAGYIVLDALIANADRHEHNWAKLTPPLQNEPEALAPSYDHATSLGHNLQDGKRPLYLSEAWRLENFAQRGRAIRFEHTGTAPTLVDHAANAVEMCTADGAHWVRTRLQDLDLAPVFEALDRGDVAVMSEVAARFAHELLDLNLRRLRRAIGNAA